MRSAGDWDSRVGDEALPVSRVAVFRRTSLAFMLLLLFPSIDILLVVFFRPGNCLVASNIYLDPLPRELFPALVLQSRKNYLQESMYNSSFPTFIMVP